MNQFNLVDVFHTFQGEGFYAGRRALFVRLPFCNLKCSWCDTEFNKFKTWSCDEFEAFILSEPNRFAVVTGGEPMMNKQTPEIIALLKQHGFTVAIETNGHFPPLPGIDWITCSPKRDGDKPYFIHPELFSFVDEFKYVVDSKFDFSVLNKHDKSDRARLSLSPEFNTFSESLDKMTNYIKENPHWKISLQTHKWTGMP